MANLFGMNIAGIINAEIANAGGVLKGTLTKVSPGKRTAGSLTGGTNPATKSYSFNGFVETREVRRTGQVGASPGAVLTVLGASVPSGVVPEVNDTALIEGITYTLVELIKRDPAAAVYEFRVET